ncbi:MAG: hypothetical protein ACOYL5_02640 [Phototrophicaceae bacterium]
MAARPGQSAFETAPIPELIEILLRQLRRPLAGVGADLDTPQIQDLAQALAVRAATYDPALGVRAGLARVIEDSRTVLAAWNLTFVQSLQSDMSALAEHWETTAEFLEIANAKSNAELRIATALALLIAFGTPHAADDVLFLLTHAEFDPESAAILRRLVAFASKTEDALGSAEWLELAEDWLNGKL